MRGPYAFRGHGAGRDMRAAETLDELQAVQVVDEMQAVQTLDEM